MNNRSQPTGYEPQREAIRVQMPDRKPVVTIALVVLTTLTFALQMLLQGITGSDVLFLYGGKINIFIMMGQVWRLLTPVLLHGSVLHIALNMYALYLIGRRLERFYGPGRFLLLYVLSAFAGNVLSFVLTPAPSLGASTSIFGIFAAEGMFIYQNRKLFGQFRTRQAIINLGVVLIINLSYGFMPGTNIDNMGHIGGLLGGIFFAWKAGPLLKLTGQPPFFSVTDARKQGDVVIASIVVLVGFAVISLIPFVTG
jgi:rhomboid protease GluP